MFVPVNNQSDGYQIAKSLRLRSSASAYLNRSMTIGDSYYKWTWSGWIKRSAIGVGQRIFTAYSASDAFGGFQFTDNDQLHIYRVIAGSGTTTYRTTNMVFRDPSAWYHIIVVYDAANATADSRVRIYVNGSELTSFATTANPNANQGIYINGTFSHRFFGAAPASYLDGYLAETYFIDNQALDPSYFGKTDPVTGAWVPKKYTGSYGTNGFYLDFKDGSSLTTLGQDKSGNGNDWTLNNVSLTSGVTYDWMDDTPTNNFAMLSPIDSASSFTISDGNLRVLTTNGTIASGRATFGLSSGKWYWEWNCASSHSVEMIGICGPDASLGIHIGNASSGYGYYANNGQKYNGGVNTAYGATYTNGDIIGVAFDADAGTIAFYKNGVSQGTAFSTIPAGTYFPALSDTSSSLATTGHLNFGQRPFAYTPPASFKALCTKNLPTPTIKNGRKYFDINTRTGTGAAGSVTGLGFAPDLVWLKCRSAATGNALYDTVRGPLNYLGSDTTSEELTVAGTVTSFNADGFSFGVQTGTNANAATFVDWMWKRGIVPGFDIVTYTGSGASRAVPHGLGVAPSFVLVKSRSFAAGWVVWHSALAGTEYLVLNTAAAKGTLATVWNSTPPDSTNIYLGTVSSTNTNGATFVAYAFAEVPGFSKFGSYTGNGSADGPFVWCGFRPRWILIKRIDSDTSSHWILWDAARSPENVADDWLLASSTNQEQSGSTVNLDILSNGFKLRNTSTNQNANGGTYIYAAFAELPFKYANAR